MTLRQAQRVARRAEAEEDSGLFLLLVVALVVLGSLGNAAGDYLKEHETWKTLGTLVSLFSRTAFVAVLLLAAWRLLRLFSPLWRWLQLRIFGPDAMDEPVLAACLAVGDPSPELAAILDRAISAYGGIIRLGCEDVWLNRDVNPASFTRKARGDLLDLLRRARELVSVETILARRRADGAGGNDLLQETHRVELNRLDAAAGLFERTEAEMGRAMLLLGAARSKSVEPGEALKETLASLSALSEVLSDASPIPAATVAAEEAEEVQVGRG